MLLIVQFRAEAMLVTPELWPGLSYIRIVDGVSVSDNSGVNLSQACMYSLHDLLSSSYGAYPWH